MDAYVMAMAMASLMICLGMFLRSKVTFLGKLLIPVNVIAGMIGLIYMNVLNDLILPEMTVSDFSNIVNEIFTLSFISIGLASVKEKKEPKTKRVKGEPKVKDETGGASIVKGSLGMGILWSLLFGLSAVLGVVIISAIGGPFGMDPMYGMLIPYAFCQGPGQAANMGLIFEDIYGLENAAMVALTFAVFGFLSAFFIGVPLAKWGLKKNLAKSEAKVSETIILRGYFLPEEQRESMGKVTTHSGNIDTLALHGAFMGLSYIFGCLIAKVVSFIPVLGPSFASMMFIWAMVGAGYVKKLLKLLNVEFLLNCPLQNKITGWASDYLVVCAFMGIKVSVIGNWIIPIAIESAIVAMVTAALCIYFTSRLGSDHDFERTVGVFGMCTGTTPSGIALVRILDPKLQTPTGTELGMTNLFMNFVMPVTIVITVLGNGTISLQVAMGLLMACVLFYLVLLKLCKTWNKPSYSLLKGEKYAVNTDGSLGVGAVIQGVLINPSSECRGIVK